MEASLAPLESLGRSPLWRVLEMSWRWVVKQTAGLLIRVSVRGATGSVEVGVLPACVLQIHLHGLHVLVPCVFVRVQPQLNRHDEPYQGRVEYLTLSYTNRHPADRSESAERRVQSPRQVSVSASPHDEEHARPMQPVSCIRHAVRNSLLAACPEESCILCSTVTTEKKS